MSAHIVDKLNQLFYSDGVPRRFKFERIDFNDDLDIYAGTYELIGFRTYQNHKLKSGFEGEEINPLTPVWTKMEQESSIEFSIFFNINNKRWELHQTMKCYIHTVDFLTCRFDKFLDLNSWTENATGNTMIYKIEEL